MARETKIEYQNKGFWIPEAFIEILSNYICKVFEDMTINTLSPNLQEIYSECDSNRNGENIGVVNILFDEFVTNEVDKSALIAVLEKTKILIQSLGEEISISVLNQFENNKLKDSFKKEWYHPIRTKSLISTLNIIQQVLNETWESTNYGIYYSGFPNPDNVIEL